MSGVGRRVGGFDCETMGRVSRQGLLYFPRACLGNGNARGALRCTALLLYKSVRRTRLRLLDGRRAPRSAVCG